MRQTPYANKYEDVDFSEKQTAKIKEKVENPQRPIAMEEMEKLVRHSACKVPKLRWLYR